jgi:hypothetical protein
VWVTNVPEVIPRTAAGKSAGIEHHLSGFEIAVHRQMRLSRMVGRQTMHQPHDSLARVIHFRTSPNVQWLPRSVQRMRSPKCISSYERTRTSPYLRRLTMQSLDLGCLRTRNILNGAEGRVQYSSGSRWSHYGQPPFPVAIINQFYARRTHRPPMRNECDFNCSCVESAEARKKFSVALVGSPRRSLLRILLFVSHVSLLV